MLKKAAGNKQLYYISSIVVEWLVCWICDQEIAVQLAVIPLSCNNTGQVVHTHMPLSPSSIS